MTENILFKLKEYCNSDFYPFHMPGHKRMIEKISLMDFPNPFSIDITEIEGFDNLHCPEGILKDSMENSAIIYDADKTYYLVNGSSSGILSAICAATNFGGKILISRNCHKSVYNGVFLNHLKAEYIYPQIIDEFGVQGGLSPENIDIMLKNSTDIQAVMIVSPTYDGIVSDIKSIAEVVHRHKIPLIVDEAHGAHFRFGDKFPASALSLGADIVIQSLHKTMPSLTQTALLHIKSDYVKKEKIEQYLRIFQTSSPSYVFMASIENCIKWANNNSKENMELFFKRLSHIRGELEKLKNLRILGNNMKGKYNIFDIDLSKIVISCDGTDMTGSELNDELRNKYHIEMEMCGSNYVVAITTVMDTEEGLLRLKDALFKIDEKLIKKECTIKNIRNNEYTPEIAESIYEGMNGSKEKIVFKNSAGRVSAEFAYIYPPGIPIIAPGEVIQEKFINTILEYKRLGLNVQGLEDRSTNYIMCRTVGE